MVLPSRGRKAGSRGRRSRSIIKKSLCPGPQRIPFSPRADNTLAAVRLHPAEAVVEGGRAGGLRPRPAPPALPAPLPAGSVQGGVRPQQEPSTVPEVPADPPGGVEGGGGALKRSEAALLPQGRQHPRRGPACIRSRRTSRAERPVGSPEGGGEGRRSPPLPRGRGTNAPDPEARRSESVLSWRGDSSRGDGGDHLDRDQLKMQTPPTDILTCEERIKMRCI